MQTLLTARQVQGRLGVDRSTVYRMAEDGRLPALKIGRQWRFSSEQIDRLLVISPSSAGMTALPAVVPARTATSVIEVAAELLGVMMVVTDLQGRPLTSVANPCAWFTDRAEDPTSIADCVAEWKLLADELDFEPQFHLGSLGVECARAYIRSGTSLVGMVIAGGLASPGNDSDDLYRLDSDQRRRVLTAMPKVAAAISRAIAPRQNPTSVT